MFKPQSAFFEAFGSRGVAVLESVLADIRSAGALSILDVKRGDIGSSMAGYASAFLGDDAPTRADAITLSPYLGVGALEPAIDAAVAGGHGLYVLARTSNPEGAPIQLARSGASPSPSTWSTRSPALNPPPTTPSGWWWAAPTQTSAAASTPSTPPSSRRGSAPRGERSRASARCSDRR